MVNHCTHDIKSCISLVLKLKHKLWPTCAMYQCPIFSVRYSTPILLTILYSLVFLFFDFHCAVCNSFFFPVITLQLHLPMTRGCTNVMLFHNMYRAHRSSHLKLRLLCPLLDFVCYLHPPLALEFILTLLHAFI